MHLRPSDDVPPDGGYFFRPSPDEPARGPFSLEQLRDLAEFGHLRPEHLIRPEGEENFSPIQDFTELSAALFPQKKSFQFRAYQKKEDVDAGYAPVDVRSIYRCDPPPSSTGEGESRPEDLPPPLPLGVQPPPLPASEAAAPVDVKVMLEASEAIARERRERPRTAAAPFSASRVFFWVRWGFAIGFFILGAVVIGGGWPLWAALPFFAFAFLFVSLDLLGWVMDAYENWVVGAMRGPPDFRRAEERYAASDWRAAAAEYQAVLQKSPRELRAYLPGIAAAAAARDQRRVQFFRLSAQKNLSAGDLNLLNRALGEHRLPLVPPPPPGELD